MLNCWICPCIISIRILIKTIWLNNTKWWWNRWSNGKPWCWSCSCYNLCTSCNFIQSHYIRSVWNQWNIFISTNFNFKGFKSSFKSSCLYIYPNFLHWESIFEVYLDRLHIIRRSDAWIEFYLVWVSILCTPDWICFQIFVYWLARMSCWSTSCNCEPWFSRRFRDSQKLIIDSFTYILLSSSINSYYFSPAYFNIYLFQRSFNASKSKCFKIKCFGIWGIQINFNISHFISFRRKTVKLNQSSWVLRCCSCIRVK